MAIVLVYQSILKAMCFLHLMRCLKKQQIFISLIVKHPPTPFIKVVSNAKLQPTTLNGGEGGSVYFINEMYYWQGIFVRKAVV